MLTVTLVAQFKNVKASSFFIGLSGENTTVDYQFPRLLLLLNVQRETNVGEIQSYFRRHDLMCWEIKGGVPLADSKQLYMIEGVSPADCFSEISPSSDGGPPHASDEMQKQPNFSESPSRGKYEISHTYIFTSLRIKL